MANVMAWLWKGNVVTCWNLGYRIQDTECAWTLGISACRWTSTDVDVDVDSVVSFEFFGTLKLKIWELYGPNILLTFSELWGPETIKFCNIKTRELEGPKSNLVISKQESYRALRVILFEISWVLKISINSNLQFM